MKETEKNLSANKDAFVALLSELKHFLKNDAIFSKAASEYFDCNFTMGNNGKLVCLILKYVDSAFSCCGWTEWWVFDDDFGENDLIVSHLGREYILKTPEQLYDFLTLLKQKK